MKRTLTGAALLVLAARVADEAAIPIGVNLMANILLDHQMKHAKGTAKK